MRKNVFWIAIAALILCAQSLYAQKDKKKFDYDIYGILAVQYFLDSRQMYSAIDGFWALYPLVPSYNADGFDINSINKHSLFATTSRIGTRLMLGDINGVDISGVIEADFTGTAPANQMGFFKMRLAYLNVKWDKYRLLIGQNWNPISLPEIKPTNKELTNGAPYNPFSRSNQIRFDYQPIDELNILAAICFQRDHVLIGVDKTRDFMQNANSFIPEMNLQLHYKKPGLLLGLGARYMAVRPRTKYFDTISQTTYKQDELMHNFTITAFVNHKAKHNNLRAQVLIGDCLNDLNLLGGYYGSNFDPTTKSFTYKPTTVFSSWIDNSVTVGSFKPAIFLGYTKNFDANETGFANAYGMGMDIDNLFRIQPRIEYYFLKGFSLTAALDYSNVKYIDRVHKDRVDSFTFSLAVYYFFNY